MGGGCGAQRCDLQTLKTKPPLHLVKRRKILKPACSESGSACPLVFFFNSLRNCGLSDAGMLRIASRHFLNALKWFPLNTPFPLPLALFAIKTPTKFFATSIVLYFGNCYTTFVWKTLWKNQRKVLPEECVAG